MSHLLFRINGVPEVASSKNKPKFHKNSRSHFVNFFLFLEADHFWHNLFFYLNKIM
ncbi:hypothetical protein HMPREF1348_01707 [Enterococcus faecium 505]|uniref:Uncharacterized protein n=1 Tax=Enterococcus faecium 505 TaxID=1134806 RepID=J6K4W2_ENTFC|nr:hypothetical protein HMPREF1348_01707 [Enterococcus faecium 505]